MQVRFQLRDIFCLKEFLVSCHTFKNQLKILLALLKNISSVMQEDNCFWFPCAPAQGSPAVHSIMTYHPDLVLVKILSFFANLVYLNCACVYQHALCLIFWNLG